MLALVLMDHALRHRAQCGDVQSTLAPIRPDRLIPRDRAAGHPAGLKLCPDLPKGDAREEVTNTHVA